MGFSVAANEEEKGNIFIEKCTVTQLIHVLSQRTCSQQRGLMLRMRIIVLEIAANCVKFIRNAGKRVRAAVAQTGLSFIECSLFVSKRTAQNECKAGI